MDHSVSAFESNSQQERLKMTPFEKACKALADHRALESPLAMMEIAPKVWLRYGPDRPAVWMQEQQIGVDAALKIADALRHHLAEPGRYRAEPSTAPAPSAAVEHSAAVRRLTKAVRVHWSGRETDNGQEVYAALIAVEAEFAASDAEERRRSFATANASIDNLNVTRAHIDTAAQATACDACDGSGNVTNLGKSSPCPKCRPEVLDSSKVPTPPPGCICPPDVHVPGCPQSRTCRLTEAADEMARLLGDMVDEREMPLLSEVRKALAKYREARG